MDKGNNLVVTQLGKIQFSFHNVKLSKNRMVAQQKHLEWDGIRKQQCASTIFHLAIQSNICVTNITWRNKNLKAKVERSFDNYKRKISCINEILFDK